MKPYFTKFEKGQNWVHGKVDKYDFEAKLFDEGSTFGINNGRVSKLSIFDNVIRHEKRDFFRSCIVNYDRGWDIEPENQDHYEVFMSVMEFLENAPKTRFEEKLNN